MGKRIAFVVCWLCYRRLSHGDDEIVWPHNSEGFLTIKGFVPHVFGAFNDLDFPINSIW